MARVLEVSAVIFCLWALTAHAQLKSAAHNTTGCRHTFCLQQTCGDLNCSGGVVVNNWKCPCCFICARQRDELCDVETTNKDGQYYYCDVGLTCQKTGDHGTGRTFGRCVGNRVQTCVHGQQHKKGCLICSCINGSETCVRDESIRCPALKRCSDGKLPYRPADLCCPVCSEIPFLGGESEFDPPSVTLLGDSGSEIVAKQRSRLSVVFDASGLEVHNVSSKLSILHNDVEINPDHRRYYSAKAIRFPVAVDKGTLLIHVEITFTIERVSKRDAGTYTLVARNDYGVTETTFELKVTKVRLQNCSFEKDTCDWMNYCSLSGRDAFWLRRSGATSTRFTGPQAGYGGSGFYLYLETSRPTVEGDKVCLRSHIIPSRRHPRTLTFAYHMYGSDVGSLTVKQTLYSEESVQFESLWNMIGDQGDQWHTANVTIGPIDRNTRSRIVFEATSGGSVGDIAIDSITLLY